MFAYGPGFDSRVVRLMAPVTTVMGNIEEVGGRSLRKGGSYSRISPQPFFY